MHVLMVSKACLVGAYQTKLEAIASHDDVRLTVIVPPAWEDPAGTVALERSHTEGYDLLVDPIRFNGRFHVHYYPRLKQRLQEVRPDILHMDEEPYNLATWLGVRQARVAGAKTLFFSWQNLHQRYPFPFSWLEKQVLDMVDFAIMGNRAAVQVWKQKGYAGPYEVIPQFGVDTRRFRPWPRPRDGDRFVVGSAGRRLVSEKGVDLLLKAAALLPNGWQVRIAGDGPERPRLEQLASELGIGDRVCFDGVIPSGAMADYLGQLDVMVLPSRTRPTWKEQFGRVLVEAMACGAVVVGSDSGEIPYVVGDAGLIFPEDDVDSLAQALRRLMADGSLMERLRAAGRQRVVDQFSQEQVATATVAVYRQMMAVDGG